MIYTQLKLFIPVKTLYVPTKLPNGKNVCFYYYGENCDFSETYIHLKIKRNFVRYYFMPTITRPYLSIMKQDIKKSILSYGLRPIRNFLGMYSNLEGYNFFFDATKFFDVLDTRRKFKRYNTQQPIKYYSNYINALSGLPDSYDKCLLYCVNIDKPVNNIYFFRRFFPVFKMMLDWSKDNSTPLPFDKVLMFIYNRNGGTYIKIFDKNYKTNNISRVRAMLMKMSISDNPENDNKDIEVATDVIKSDEEGSKEQDIDTKRNMEPKVLNYTANELSEKNKENSKNYNMLKNITSEKISQALRNYTTFNKGINISNHLSNRENIATVAKSAIIYNVIGDPIKTQILANKLKLLPIEKQEDILQTFSNFILLKDKVESSSTNKPIEIAKTHQITDYQNPSHILNKRKYDFNIHLKTDIKNSFNVLKDREMPVEVEKLEVKLLKSPPSEINKSLKDRYFVYLKLHDGRTQKIYIDLPHLTENGTFIDNNIEKILVNQMIRFPIFFPQINVGRFESSYSVIRVISKELRTGAYFILYMGSYKIPIISYFSYKFGLKEALKKFKVDYEIRSK